MTGIEKQWRKRAGVVHGDSEGAEPMLPAPREQKRRDRPSVGQLARGYNVNLLRGGLPSSRVGRAMEAEWKAERRSKQTACKCNVLQLTSRRRVAGAETSLVETERRSADARSETLRLAYSVRQNSTSS